jgi:hypothetical protein
MSVTYGTETARDALAAIVAEAMTVTVEKY